MEPNGHQQLACPPIARRRLGGWANADILPEQAVPSSLTLDSCHQGRGCEARAKSLSETVFQVQQSKQYGGYDWGFAVRVGSVSLLAFVYRDDTSEVQACSTTKGGRRGRESAVGDLALS